MDVLLRRHEAAGDRRQAAYFSCHGKRLIKQARNEGIVEIRIRPDFMKMYEIEDELRGKSNLEYVIVVPETHNIEESLCRGAAHLINDVLDSRGNLGSDCPRH